MHERRPRDSGLISEAQKYENRFSPKNDPWTFVPLGYPNLGILSPVACFCTLEEKLTVTIRDFTQASTNKHQRDLIRPFYNQEIRPLGYRSALTATVPLNYNPVMFALTAALCPYPDPYIRVFHWFIFTFSSALIGGGNSHD